MGSINLASLGRWVAAFGLSCMWGVASAAPFAFISNSGDGTVSVVDLATVSVVKTVEVGSRPLGVAVSRDGGRVYVVDLHDESIAMLDGSSHEVLATESIDMVPRAVAVNGARSRVYVVGHGTGGGGRPGASLLLVLDANTLAPVARVPLEGRDASHVAVSPDDAQVWVSVGQYEVVVIDAASHTLSQRATVQAGGLSPLAFGPNPRVAYVGGNRNLITVDMATLPPGLGNVPMMTGAETFGLALSPGGDRAYVAKDGLGLEVYDLKRQERLAIVETGRHPGAVAVHPDGSRIYVVNPVENALGVVDAATLSFLGNIRVGKNPIVFGQFVQPAPPPAAAASSSRAWASGPVIVLALLVLALLAAVFLYFRFSRA